jgi:hypothetical protein
MLRSTEQSRLVVALIARTVFTSGFLEFELIAAEISGGHKSELPSLYYEGDGETRA